MRVNGELIEIKTYWNEECPDPKRGTLLLLFILYRANQIIIIRFYMMSKVFLTKPKNEKTKWPWMCNALTFTSSWNIVWNRIIISFLKWDTMGSRAKWGDILDIQFDNLKSNNMRVFNPAKRKHWNWGNMWWLISVSIYWWGYDHNECKHCETRCNRTQWFLVFNQLIFVFSLKWFSLN